MTRLNLIALSAAAVLALPMAASAGILRGGCNHCGGSVSVSAAPAAPAVQPAPAAPAPKAAPGTPAPVAGPVAPGAPVASGFAHGGFGGGKLFGGCGAGGCGNGFGGFGKWAGKWEGKMKNEAPATGSGKLGHGFFQPPFQAAPWYLYWPYDAHFQLPAPIGAPYYPPQNLNTPWNPYFAHPALGLTGYGQPAAPGGFAPVPQQLVPGHQ
jgi:hypothetical protein